MSVNHPISDSGSDNEDYLPPGLQSDASSDSPTSSPERRSNRTSSLDAEEDDARSRASSKTPSMQDEYLFEEGEEGEEGTSTARDPTMTNSFVSLPEGMEQPGGEGAGPGAGDTTTQKAGVARKRHRRKSGVGESPRRRRKKGKRGEGDEEDNSEGKEKRRPGEKKSRGKQKNKNKPTNRRRNIKTFLREDQLDADTLSAQREEEERRKRLEEERKKRLEEQKTQKTKELSTAVEIAEQLHEAEANLDDVSSETLPALVATPALPPTLPPIKELEVPQVVTIPVPVSLSMPISSECIMVDSGSESERDAKMPQKQESEVITISSDEEVTLVSDNSDEEADMDSGSSGLHTNDEVNVPDIHGRILVNVNHPPDELDIYLPDHITRAVKPHQVGGIRFLYDNLVESLSRFKASSGFGCILAHSMGLGKTLQCIAFTSIFMQHAKAHTVLCIVPINTLQNWLAEFDMWCPERPRHFNIFVLNDVHKTTASRAKVIADWHKNGGVMLMGYEMYRLLARSKQTTLGRSKKKTSKSGKSSPQVIDIDEMEAAAEMAVDIKAALCNPGPDMVVCDEGHRIKNSHAGISQALKNIRTRRRVVLTGYPLQNNLQEYWCMVDFVRPNFLGTRHEFANLFERPISNGQCIDSTPFDVRLMRYRAHVLHSLLSGFVQRRGFNVLLSTLPPKEEHVLMIRLTSFQRGLYIRFMQCFKEAGAGGWCTSNPLKAFSVGCKIWNHPDILSDLLNVRDSMADDLDADLDLPEIQAKCTGKVQPQKGGKKGSSEDKSPKRGDSAGGGGSGSGSGSRSGAGAIPPGGYVDKVQQIISFEWARDIMKNYTRDKLLNGGKMIVLFHVLEESIRLGDKILVFSQSLSTLTLIEKFLSQSSIPLPPNPPPLMPRNWVRNKTYFRLDGSTAVSEREKMINQFNSPENKTTWLFLLSTKAGCLGINLIGANRVVVMDASWNPCHDAQAVCRVYRYGQAKKCYVYRLVSDQTLEKKIYDRQVSKKGMSDRVVDEMNPEMNLTKKEVESLLEFDETDMPYEDFSHLAGGMDDSILRSLVCKHSSYLTKAPFTTESLLWDRKDTKLTRAEKMQAKKSYEEEKKLNLSYSRPSYSNFYPKGSGGGMSLPPPAKGVHGMGFNTGPPYPYMGPLKQPLQRPVANVRPIQSTPVPRHPPTPMEITQKRIRDLKMAGVTLQRIVATTDIMLPGANTTTDSTSMIRAGETVTFIKTKKGIYLRTHEGKILAVRGPNAGPGSLSAVAEGAFPSRLGGEMGEGSGGMEGRASPGSSSSEGGDAVGQTGLAGTQLGRLLSQNPLRGSFHTPRIPAMPDASTGLQMPGTSSAPGFPFSMSSSISLGQSASGSIPTTTIAPFSSSGGMTGSIPYSSTVVAEPNAPISAASTSSTTALPYSTQYSLGNSSTLTMATDTIMHQSSGVSTTHAPSQPFPASHGLPTSVRQPDTQQSFDSLYSSPSPPFNLPSFGDDPWASQGGQGSGDMNQETPNVDQASLPMPLGSSSISRAMETISQASNLAANLNTTSMSGISQDGSSPSTFQHTDHSLGGGGSSTNSLSDTMATAPSPMEETPRSISLPPSLPYPQLDRKSPFPPALPIGGRPSVAIPHGGGDSNATSTLVSDSDISNLSRFVDSTFPSLMPYSGSLNPDGELSSGSDAS